MILSCQGVISRIYSEKGVQLGRWSEANHLLTKGAFREGGGRGHLCNIAACSLGKGCEKIKSCLFQEGSFRCLTDHLHPRLCYGKTCRVYFSLAWWGSLPLHPALPVSALPTALAPWAGFWAWLLGSLWPPGCTQLRQALLSCPPTALAFHSYVFGVHWGPRWKGRFGWGLR